MKLVPEWLTHKYCCIAWPCNKDLYANVLDEAKIQIANLVNEISSDEVVWLFCNQEDIIEAKNIINNSKVELIPCMLDDSWMRDIAPIFINNKGSLESICFEFNGYGKYPNFTNDNEVANLISQKLKINYINSDIILEGGAISYDDEGNLFVTESVLLNENRNNNLTKQQYEIKLIKLFGLKKIIWFGEGLIGDDTDGHIDNLICPIGNQNYLIASCEDQNNINYDVLNNNKKIFNEIFKNKANLIELPIPDEVVVNDKKLVSSYINFYFTENKIILPKFMTKQDSQVYDIFSSLFPKKNIIMLDTRAINYGGGNIHCVTMNIPNI